MNEQGLYTRTAFALFSGLLLAGAGAAAYLQSFWPLAIPFCVLLFFAAARHPRTLLYGLLAAVPPSVEYSFSSSLGTDLPDEPLMLAVAGLAVLLSISRPTSLIRPLHPLLFLLGLQLAWLVVPVLRSTYPLLSVKFLLAKSWYLLAFVAAPLLLLRSERHVRTAAAALTLSMMLLVVLSLLRHAALGFTFEEVNPALSPFFRNHVTYSALLACILPILFQAWRTAGSGNWRRVYSALLLVGLAALYFSYARGAWLAVAGSALIYWLVRKKWLVHGYVLAIAITFVTFAALTSKDRYLALAPDYRATVFHTDFREHLVATYKGTDLSTAERFYRWVAGVRMVPRKWLTGFGPGTFYNNYKSYTLPAFRTWVSDNKDRSTVHNYFLLTLVEQGVPGLFFLLLLLGLLFRYAQKIAHRGHPFWSLSAATCAVILFVICVVNFLSDLIETDKIGSIFYLCLSFLVLADYRTRKEASDPATNV